MIRPTRHLLHNAESFLRGQLGVRLESMDFLDRHVFQSRAIFRTIKKSQQQAVPFHRKELLGDKVLELCVVDILLKDNPQVSSKSISYLVQKFVGNDRLADKCIDLGIADHLDHYQNLASQRPTLANVMEAMIGEIYHQNGFDAARAFVETHIYNDQGRKPQIRRDLQENQADIPRLLSRHIQSSNPEAVVSFKTTLSTPKGHEVVMEINGKVLGRGQGPSKKFARVAAATAAATKLGIPTEKLTTNQVNSSSSPGEGEGA